MARLQLGTRAQYRWLTGMVVALLILNLLDALFTLVWIRAGLAREGNILLRNLVVDHPLGFLAVKLSLVTLGSGLLWRYRQRPLAVVGLFAVFLMYYFVLLYHLRFASLVLQAWMRV